jgi:uncharacterized protein YndB with AHSA1/START domain
LTTLILASRIKARSTIVFEAITTAEGIAQWWGPDAGPVLLAEADVRVGGRYRLRFRTLDGTEHETRGVYLELVRPERVVMSWHWTGGTEDPGGSRLRYAPFPKAPKLTFTHSQLHDEETRRTHEAGWAGSLRKLEARFVEQT